MWIDGPAKNAREFANIRGQLEVGSFESEIKVYLELTKFMPGSQPAEFEWRNQHGIPQAEKNLVSLYSSGGRSALESFVLDEAYVEKKSAGLTSYQNNRQYYESGYQKYVSTFDNDRLALLHRYSEQAIRTGNY